MNPSAWLRNLLLVLFIVLYCQQSTQGRAGRPQHPDFKIQVELTEEAERWMRESGESIEIRSWFADEIGPGGLHLATHTQSIKDQRVAVVSNVRFDPKLAAVLPDPDYEVLVNLSSSRQKDDRTMLDCDILQGPISQFQGRVATVPCKLVRPKPSAWEAEPSFTGEIKAQQFLSRCSVKLLSSTQPADRAKADFCIGIVKGAIQAHESFVQSEDHPIPRHFCIPEAVSDVEFTVAVLKSIAPGQQSVLGNLLLGGLHQAYPCQPRRTRQD